MGEVRVGNRGISRHRDQRTQTLWLRTTGDEIVEAITIMMAGC